MRRIKKPVVRAKDDQTARVVPVVPRDGAGRNDPCICGSGKKFKRCCLTIGLVGKGEFIHHVALEAGPGAKRVQQVYLDTMFASR